MTKNLIDHEEIGFSAATSLTVLPSYFGDGSLYLGPRFDAQWYTATYAHLAAGADPFGHYITKGRAFGCKPNVHVLKGIKLRDPQSLTLAVLINEARFISESGIFDEDWYSFRYGILSSACLSHFVLSGAYEGFDPNPFFSTESYYIDNEDVAAKGVNCLSHYLSLGYAEARRGLSEQKTAGAIVFDENIWAKGIRSI